MILYLLILHKSQCSLSVEIDEFADYAELGSVDKMILVSGEEIILKDRTNSDNDKSSFVKKFKILWQE